MTANEFQDNILTLLANSSYCRYWLCWRNDTTKNLWLAVQLVELMPNQQYKVVECEELLSIGFEKIDNGGPMYIIPRTREDGTQYESFFL